MRNLFLKKKKKNKLKPFKFVKFFTFSGLIVMFIGTILLSVLNTHWAKSMLIRKSGDYARALIKNLNHQIILQISFPIYIVEGKAFKFDNKEQYERMDKVVKATLHGFKLENVTLYQEREDIIIYSFDKTLLGKRGSGGKPYKDALEGNSTSELAQITNFWKMLIGYPASSKIITYAPVNIEPAEYTISIKNKLTDSMEQKKFQVPKPGMIIGVIEIVQDVSNDYKEVFDIQKKLILSCSVVMGFLFLILFFVVRKGEKLFQKRAMERLKLEEQLSRSKHLSSLGEMTAGISHEIRNPLGIIKSSAELLKKKMDRIDEKNTIPTIIVEEANRLNNIITDFLNYAKPKTPKLSPCNISDIINKNLVFLETEINEKNIHIVTDIKEDLPLIHADFDMLYQVFLNIIINAMQAIEKDGTITIKIIENNHHIKVYFIDNGCGISDVSLEKIWNPFFTTKEKGTGLGLGLVKKIIGSHSGKIDIHNRHEQTGVEVIVSFPVLQEI